MLANYRIALNFRGSKFSQIRYLNHTHAANIMYMGLVLSNKVSLWRASLADSTA